MKRELSLTEFLKLCSCRTMATKVKGSAAAIKTQRWTKKRLRDVRSWKESPQQYIEIYVIFSHEEKPMPRLGLNINWQSKNNKSYIRSPSLLIRDVCLATNWLAAEHWCRPLFKTTSVIFITTIEGQIVWLDNTATDQTVANKAGMPKSMNCSDSVSLCGEHP